VSEPLLAELAEVLARPRIARRYGVTSADTKELVSMLRAHAEEVQVSGDVRICRDPDDDMVVETALRGSANALVTRDEDLKGASEVISLLAEMGVAVLSVKRFLAAI
jgi:putative PIN family toxin of toxin-antitoxin system